MAQKLTISGKDLMKKFGFILATIIFYGCLSTSESENDWKESLDRIHFEIKSLRDSLHVLHEKLKQEQNSKTNIDSLIHQVELTKDTSETLINKPKQKPVRQKSKIRNATSSSNDTIYHYFTDGKLSVKMSPRGDRQKVWVFLRKGELIQEYENVRMSYQVSHDISFRDDGSIQKVKIHFNPGASRYWYTEEITFNSDNMPIIRHVQQHPADTMEAAMGIQYYWDSESKIWI